MADMDDRRRNAIRASISTSGYVLDEVSPVSPPEAVSSVAPTVTAAVSPQTPEAAKPAAPVAETVEASTVKPATPEVASPAAPVAESVAAAAPTPEAVTPSTPAIETAEAVPAAPTETAAVDVPVSEVAAVDAPVTEVAAVEAPPPAAPPTSAPVTLTPAAATPATPEVAHDTVAIVKKGDNLWKMVKEHFGLTTNKDIANKLKEIQALNGMDDKQAGRIKPGQNIIMEKAPVPTRVAEGPAAGAPPAGDAPSGSTYDEVPASRPAAVAAAPDPSAIMNDDPAAVASSSSVPYDFEIAQHSSTGALAENSGPVDVWHGPLVVTVDSPVPKELKEIDFERFQACFQAQGWVKGELSCKLNEAAAGDPIKGIQPFVGPQTTFSMDMG